MSLQTDSEDDEEKIIYMDDSPDWKEGLQFPFKPREVKTRQSDSFEDFYKASDVLQGEGKFGSVYKCIDRSTGLELAAKYVATENQRQKSDLEREVSILNQLQHPGIAQLFDVFADKKSMILVTELVKGGELFERVADDHFVLTEQAVAMVICQLCEALAYIHDQGVVHLDIKPENVMCVSRRGNQIKIVDFGLAQKWREGLLLISGTPEFIAPEIVAYTPVEYTSDMWSVGVIAYILLSGLSPFLGDSDRETYANVSKGEWEFYEEEFARVSDTAKDFVSKLLVYDKRKRMTAKESLAHPWLDVQLWIPNNKLTKEKFKKYVVKRRWKKAYHAITALKAMGVNLKEIK